MTKLKAEILSIETIEKIARLERENKQLQQENKQLKEREGYCYQEYEPTPNKPCEIKTRVVGKNLLDKQPELTGQKIPNIIGITELQYYEYEKLQQENKQLKDNWNELKEIIDVKMYNSEYLINLCGYKVDVDTLTILKIIKEQMQKLESGDSNE